MAEKVNLIEEVKKHPIPVAALAGGVGLIIWRARQSLAAGASAIPVPAGAPASADTGTSIPSGGYPSTSDGTDLTNLTSNLSSAFAQLQSEIAGLGSASAAQTALQAQALPAQEYLAGYTPAAQLQQAAVSATQSAGQTLADNCSKVTHCQGIFGCIGNFFTSAIGCVGQAAITVGTAVGATVLPSVQTATNALANYAPSILGAGLGIPGLPKAPAATPTAPAPGVGYYPYGAAPTAGVPYYPYTPPISPYTAAPAAPKPALPVPVAPAPTIFPIGDFSV